MSYTFFRWMRFGVAAALSDGVLEGAPGGPRAQMSVGVEVSNGSPVSRVAPLAIDVLGPGDVAGIDQRQVIRTFPVGGTLDFEADYLAHVELDRPDLPWLFTPAAPDAGGALRPWMCLVVVRKRDGVTVTMNTPLPRLTMADAAGSELPALTDAHLWAHVQVGGAISTPLDRIASDEPERILSRLICPRVLQPNESYYACLVPTYNVGVDAGLGRPVPTTATLSDAWSPGTAAVELPVYFHWEFSTGLSGDFKSLVKKLKARHDLPGVGTRQLDISEPGFGVAPRAQATAVDLGGALAVAAPDAPPIDATLADDLADALAEDGVAPPIYGRWHAGVPAIVRGAAGPSWLEALNLDVRYRVAAGIGTEVVQERQEDLMAAIWEQVGEILRANQLLRQAQLAVAASERIVTRNLSRLLPAELLSIAGPALGRVQVGPQTTARRVVADSCAPMITFSGAFRRLVRTRGPLGRRATRLQHPALGDLMPAPAVNPSTLVELLASGAVKLPRAPMPNGAVIAPQSLLASRARPRDPGAPLGDLSSIFARLARSDREAACPPLDSGTLASQVRQAMTPDLAIPKRVRAQITLPATARVHLSDRLDPVMAAPEIPTPMIGALIERGQDWLLPGLASVPQDTATMVQPDAAFIEAYMVGLNHEIGREMLWRGFPTDQRGTVFAKFWDRRGAAPSTPVPDRDIPAIAGWNAADALGSHLEPGVGAGVILLIRGALLQRYPRATIYIQRGRWKRDGSNEIVFSGNLAVREPVPLPDDAAWSAHVYFPTLVGRLGSDVTYLGFPLDRHTVRGLDRNAVPARASDADAGWYVVIQEQPTEPRFGFPATPPAIPAGATTSDGVAAALMRPAFRLFVQGRDLVSEP